MKQKLIKFSYFVAAVLLSTLGVIGVMEYIKSDPVIPSAYEHVNTEVTKLLQNTESPILSSEQIYTHMPKDSVYTVLYLAAVIRSGGGGAIPIINNILDYETRSMYLPNKYYPNLYNLQRQDSSARKILLVIDAK